MLDLDFQGDEIPETTTRIRRRVWTDDPNDLSVGDALRGLELDFPVGAGDPELDGLRPAAVRVLSVLDAVGSGRCGPSATPSRDEGCTAQGAHDPGGARRSSWRPDLADPTGFGRFRRPLDVTPCAFDRFRGRRCLLTRAHIAHAHYGRTVRTMRTHAHPPIGACAVRVRIRGGCMSGLDDLFSQIEDEPIPGGCDSATRTRRWTMTPGVHSLTVHHDDWCPVLRATKSGTN